MATYVTLCSFTDQGIRNVKDSPDRLEAFKTLLEKNGCSLKCAYYTIGSYDVVTVVEGPDDTVTAALLKVGTLGNIRTQTMRAYSPDEIRKVLGKLP